MFAFIAFVPNAKKVFDIIKREKILTFFLIWALISITWSAYPLVSIKRWFQVFNYLFIPLVFFSYCKSIQQIIGTIKPILFIYLSLSIIVVFIIPGAKDPLFGTWRGFSPHKNALGQIVLMCTILMSLLIIYETNLYKKIINFMYLLIAIVLLIGAFSSTIILAFVLFASASFIYYLQASVFNKLGIGRFVALSSIFSFAGIFYLIYSQTPEIIESLNLTGKDITTFSDRTYLWEYMMFEITKHPILGCGFRGFWVIGSIGIQTIWNRFLFLPIQAHNGYLDIMNEMGVIGLSFLAMTVLNYFKQVRKVGNQSLWVWFILLPLFINLTETTLFREGHITFIFFIIAYLLPFAFPTSDPDLSEYNPGRQYQL